MTTTQPPQTLDGAVVLYFCSLDHCVQPTGRHSIQLEDGSIYTPTNVAICRYDYDPTIYRFYCDDGWEVVTDMDYTSIEEAIDTVEQDYSGVRQHFRKAHPQVAREQWYLMDCDFPHLNWARLRVYTDGTAEIFDRDGCTLRYATEAAASEDLRMDEYVALEDLNEEDMVALQRPLTAITPPRGETDEKILTQMYQLFND
jgi:hypothetical protein